ncbi:MAG TPA: branched-chain amino acid ABC transporter permease [Candidatus Dormibacteraeota bacterium]|nr:branched-chain amino acid ABC transporter permease [Candidatus Dormibacteraeota bacterium]
MPAATLGVVIDGVLVGGLYALVSIGLTLVFGVMRLVNLAHGELIVGGAYLAIVSVGLLHWNPFLALLVVAPLLAAIAYPLQRWLLNPLLPAGLEAPLVATFGLSLIAQTLFLLLFSGNPRSLQVSYAVTGITVFGHPVRTVFLIGGLGGGALIVATYLLVSATPFGRSLRAAAEDPEAAATVGINVPHVYALTLALSAALASVAGVMIAIAFSVTPTTGLSWLLRGFTVIVLGGMRSIWGTLAGGILIGLLEESVAAAIGPTYQDLIVFSALVVVLLLRPQGLFGGGHR